MRFPSFFRLSNQCSVTMIRIDCWIRGLSSCGLRFVIALVALSTALSNGSFAESAECTTPVLILPDGRLTQSSIPQAATYWYGIYAQANHSYSVEFVPQADNFFNSYRPQFGSITMFSPTDSLQACKGNSTVTVSPTSGYFPVINRSSNGAGRRASFTASVSGLHLISVTNVGGSGVYSFRAVDTTLFNMRWNTLAGSDVQWVIFNISDMGITGYISVIDTSGQLVASVPISLPAGGRVSRSSAVYDLNLQLNLTGSALFSYNGPPGAIMAEAFMISPTAIVQERFATITF